MNRISYQVDVLLKGHQPFTPHLYHYLDQEAMRQGYFISWHDWMEQCQTWLQQSEALLFLAPSPGANIERQLATELGLPIYHSIDEIPPA